MSAADKAVVKANTDYSPDLDETTIVTDILNPEVYEAYTAEFFRQNPNAPKATPIKWVQR